MFCDKWLSDGLTFYLFVFLKVHQAGSKNEGSLGALSRFVPAYRQPTLETRKTIIPVMYNHTPDQILDNMGWYKGNNPFKEPEKESQVYWWKNCQVQFKWKDTIYKQRTHKFRQKRRFSLM